MNWTRSVKGKGTRVFRGSVALMILETIGRVKRGEFRHGPVPGDFGDHRGRRDGGTARVAVDDGPFLAWESGHPVAVDKAHAGLHGKSRDGAAHGQPPRAHNVVRLGFLD